MTIKAMFSGAIVASSWTVDWTDSVAGGPTTVAIPDGTYYVLGDGSADDLLEAMFTAIDAVAGVTLQYTISDAGLVGFAVDAGTATLAATAGGGSAELGAVLGFAVSSLALTQSYSYAGRQSRRLVVSTLPTRVDVPTTMARRSVAESDDYTRSTLTLSSAVRRYAISMRYGGPHRSTSYTDYDMWLSFFEETIVPGYLVRWYPDRSVSTAAYAQKTNPYGYHVGRITSPTEYTPNELVPGWYRWYVVDVELLEQTS